MMRSKRLAQVLSLYNISQILSTLKLLISSFPCWLFVRLPEKLLSRHFDSCSLSPCTVDIDDRTTVHFWAPTHRKFNRPTLVLIHGYGGHSLWQFTSQVRSLSQAFNLYVPDLLFFGKSRSTRDDRSVVFQAVCIREGLRKLGLERYSLAGISYGGFVAYRMGDMYREEVEKVVVIGSGICYTEKQKEEQMREIGSNIVDLLVPRKPEDMRGMVKLALYRSDPLKWVPDWIVSQFINVSDLVLILMISLS